MLRNKYVLMEEATDGTKGAGGADITTTDATKTDDTTKTTTVITDTTKADATKTDATVTDATKAAWPADWQERLAKGDDKRAAHVKRYASPEAMADALIAAQNRIRSGELKSALPENPKAEELAAWRKDNGIPESPDKYDLKFDDGLVIGKDDKPIVDAFLKSAHDVNMQPNQVKATVAWYYKEQERAAEAQAVQDDQQRVEALDTLNVEWGTDFRKNVNLIQGTVLSRFPTPVRDAIQSARLPDGRALFNHPEVLRTLAAIALELNPAGIVTPAGSGDMAKTVDDEIKQIEAKMGTKAYIKDEKIQSRYRELIDARDKMQRKAA